MKQYLLMFRRPDSRTHELVAVTAVSEEQARRIGTEIERDLGLDLELHKLRPLGNGDLPD